MYLRYSPVTEPALYEQQEAQVDVRGWTKFEGNPAKKDNWIEDFSDHTLICLEVSA